MGFLRDDYVFGNCNKLTTVTSHIQEPIARNTNVRSRPIPVGGFVVFSVIMGSTEPPFCPNAAAPEILPHTKLHEGLVCRISYSRRAQKKLAAAGTASFCGAGEIRTLVQTRN